MAGNSQTELMQYVLKDIQEGEGLRMPVKAGRLEQMVVRKLPPEKLHPNPADEFSMEKIGPNYSIIESYVHRIRKNREMEMKIFDEPVLVEKIRPDGYLLINGHHRWAAARKLMLKSIPVQIVNITHASDILKQLNKNKREKRASINLDDVILCQKEEDLSEKGLKFPYNRFYKDRIRLGVPALIHNLQQEGFDVWIYTFGYASSDYIERLLSKYQIHADGIINGARHKNKEDQKLAGEIKSEMERKYSITLHIDLESALLTKRGETAFHQRKIKEKDERWSKEAISSIHFLEKKLEENDGRM